MMDFQAKHNTEAIKVLLERIDRLKNADMSG